MICYLIGFASLLLVVPALGQSQPTISNLVNKGFETCVNGSAPVGWQQGGSGNDSSALVLCSNTRAHTGTYSARFVPFSVTKVGNRTTYVGELSQSVSFLQGGQPITLSYWVNFADVPVQVDSSTIGSYNFTVTYNNNDDQRISISPQFVPGSGTPSSNFFYQFKAMFNAPSSNYQNGTLTIAFQSNQPSINIYLDDVELTSPLIAGDPSFVGLLGQHYQVHGIDGEVYNLVSSNVSQVNARFVFLDDGECPIIDDMPAINCWSHAGSYLGEIGIQQRVGDHVNKLIIVAGSGETGFQSVSINDALILVNDSFNDTSSFMVSYESSHRLRIQTQEFIYTFDNSDRFINQQIVPLVALQKLESHGLFGQKHRAAVYASKLKYIEGSIDDYLVNEGELFGVDFVFNQFKL